MNDREGQYKTQQLYSRKEGSKEEWGGGDRIDGSLRRGGEKERPQRELGCERGLGGGDCAGGYGGQGKSSRYTYSFLGSADPVILFVVKSHLAHYP